MDNEIIVDENLLDEITRRYAREYGTLPRNHKQAIQYAYNCGRIDQKREEHDSQVIF